MFEFLRSLFSLVGLFAVVLMATAFWFDINQMDPGNGHYMKGGEAVLAGESISFESVEATPEGYAKRGFLLDLLLECRTGRLNLELFKWQFNLGKMSESEVQLHKPNIACKKRGLQTLF